MADITAADSHPHPAVGDTAAARDARGLAVTSLVEIISRLIAQPGRATVELPRGLWLVYYPPVGDAPARLVAGRYLSHPSERELVTVRNHLLEVLDADESRVAYDLGSWFEIENNDWHGCVTSWRATNVAEAFSPDPDRAALIRRALERRADRIEERREKELSRKRGRAAAATPGPKPLL